jgi:ubiquinone/menaquinone biosynthesis C-methylase UbiE
MPTQNVIVIIYTTLYRKGGGQFPIVAKTLAHEKAGEFVGQIITRPVESKRDVLQVLDEVKSAGKLIEEFHFVGHSGIYGPMFGTVKFPEQFSPYEWETLEIPFAESASAYFHCCRSARWFAPFFARTFNIKSCGFFWYTTFSLDQKHFRHVGANTSMERLYTIGCKGRKSHGLLASAGKFAGLMPAEEMKSFEPQSMNGDATYNKVAELYDLAFSDIRVRKDEWNWLNEHLPESTKINVLDIGCGNGALLNALSERISSGVGVDESKAILKQARVRNGSKSNIEFVDINGPVLPFEDGKFDIVVSLMSFRYLDWDPLLLEIKRVSKKGGKFLVIDMVTVPVGAKEYPALLKDKLRTMFSQKTNPDFKANLAKLVSHPDWKKMLEYNPIRSEHEMKWYLESRFPGQKMEILNLGWNARIVAFDSGAIEHSLDARMSYP